MRRMMLSVAIVPIVGNDFSLQIRNDGDILYFWRVNRKDLGDRVGELMQEWKLIQSHFSTHHNNTTHKDCYICQEEI